MPDYAGLLAEITKPAYDGLTDQQTADALNAPITVIRDVRIADVVGYLAVNGKLPLILNYSGADQAAQATCTSFKSIITTPSLTTFECSKPGTYAAIQSFLSAFVAASLISADDQAALLALAQATSTRARELGFGQATVAQIAAARAGAATTSAVVRIVYSAATRQARRVVVPSTEADLAAHTAGTGEAILDVLATDYQSAGGTSGLAQLVSSGTGLPVLIAVVVDANKHVIGNVACDPACGDVLTGDLAGQTIAMQAPAPVTLGWLWDGGVTFSPQG